MAGRLCKGALDRARSVRVSTRFQPTISTAERDGALGVLSNRSESTAGQCETELADQGIDGSVPLSSLRYLRRPDFEAQALAKDVCLTGRVKVLRPWQCFIDSRLHRPVGSLPGFADNRGFRTHRSIGIESSPDGDAHGRSPSWTDTSNPESSLRGFHSTSQEWASSALTGEDAVTDQQGSASDEIEEQVSKELEERPHISLAEGVGYSPLDLPKIENPTTVLINRVCEILDVEEWGPSTAQELEDLKEPFTSFLIQQIVQRKSDNVDVTWAFFQWARDKCGHKLSVNAHIVMLDVLGRAQLFEIMKEAFTFVLIDGHKKSAWPFNNALKWASKAKDVESALYFWRKMKEIHCKPTVVTYTRLIDLLARQGQHQEALETFREMLKANCPPNITTYNVLIHAFGVAGQPDVACSLFDKLSELGCKPNYLTFHTLVTMHVEAGNPEKALKFFNMMKAAGMEIGDDISSALRIALPNRRVAEMTSTEETDSSGTEDKTTTTICTSSLDVDFPLPGASGGRIIHHNTLARMLEEGKPDSVEAKLEKIKPKIHPRFVVQVLQRLNPDAALIFFDWAKAQPEFKHNEFSYSLMINILGRSRNSEALDRVLKDMQEDNIPLTTPIFTSVITCYGRAKNMTGALMLFERMKQHGCLPDTISYTSIIHLCGKHGYPDKAMEFFEEMKQNGIQPNTRTYSVMIFVFVRLGKVTEALALLKEMPALGCQPSPITYATLIDHCAKTGLVDVATDLYLQMDKEGIKPLRTTVSVLDATLRKAGNVEAADTLVKKYRNRRFWDETFKTTTEKVAQELLFKDLDKDELERKSTLLKV